MNEDKSKTKITFKLPERIVGSVDLRRITRELATVDDFLYQANLRTPGTPNSPPKTTKLLNDLFEGNGQSMLDTRSRKNMLNILKKLEEKAPVIHISFAVEPNPSFMEKIVKWARENVHSYTLVNNGLQPTVIVGCSLRTTNKVFDMSLRNRFETSKYILTDRIKKMAESEALND